MSTSFRTEIEGLRGCAVLAVVLYHLGLSVMSGGYVGVDVFFVISGYLITQIIWRDQEEGHFRLGAFYLRRAKRLLPALFATLFFTVAASALVLGPGEFTNLAESALYAIVSTSNFLFYFQSGYFDDSAIQKSLLHTWSLGVEEQFYLLWPLLLASLAAYRTATILLLGLASLLAAEFMLARDPAAAFFLMPFRVFEFCIGSAAVLIEGRGTQARPLRQWLSAGGIVLFVTSLLVLDEESRFPGVNALLPCLAAFLIILGRADTLVGRALSGRVMRYFGRVSYSMYLVHWPIIALYCATVLVTPEEFSLLQIVTLLGAILVAGHILHTTIENALRPAQCSLGQYTMPSSAVLAGSFAALLLSLSSAFVVGNNAFLARKAGLSPAILTEMAAVESYKASGYAYSALRAINRPFADNGQLRVLVIGDSMAGDLVHSLNASGLNKGKDMRSIVISAKCQPILTDADLTPFVADKYQDNCKRSWRNLANSPRIEKADVILIAANWRPWSARHAAETVGRLQRRTPAHVLVFTSKGQGYSGQELLARHGRLEGLETLSAELKNDLSWEANRLLKQQLAAPALVDLMAQICPTERSCNVLSDDQKILFYDQYHITEAGARFIGEGLQRNNLGQRMVQGREPVDTSRG